MPSILYTHSRVYASAHITTDECVELSLLKRKGHLIITDPMGFRPYTLVRTIEEKRILYLYGASLLKRFECVRLYMHIAKACVRVQLVLSIGGNLFCETVKYEKAIPPRIYF